MEEKKIGKRFEFEVGIDRGGLEIYSEVVVIDEDFDWEKDEKEFWESEDEEVGCESDDCNLSEKIGRGCKSLISYYETYGVYDYKDKFIKRIMGCKDVDIDWDEKVEKYFIEVFFDGDVEKMKNYKL